LARVQVRLYIHKKPTAKRALIPTMGIELNLAGLLAIEKTS
jgi:hypothetical protein